MSTLQDFRNINQSQADKAATDARHRELLQSSVNQQRTILQAIDSLIRYLEHHTGKTEVVNQLQEIGTPDALKVVSAIEDLHSTLKTHENTDLSEVAGLLKQVLSEAKAIPKELAKADIPTEITVKNPVDNSKDLQALLKAVQAIKLVAEAPQVTVPAPVVNVDAPDLKPLDKGLQAVRKAVEGIVMPDIPVTDLGKLEKLQEKANKLLKEISEIRISGGGSSGGGRATPYEDSNAVPAFVTLNNGSIPVTIASNQSVIPTQLMASQPMATGTITSATSTVTTTNLAGVGAATISIYGTYAGVNFLVEGYDGVNWYVIGFRAASANANPPALLATGVITANSSLLYEVPLVLGLQQLRVRATAYTSGTANITIEPSAQFGPMVMTVNGAVTASGTVTANLGTGGTAATSLGKAEDAVHATGDTGVAVWAVRNDNAAVVSTSATGDYSPFAVDANGRQFLAVSSTGGATPFTLISAASTNATLVKASAGTLYGLYAYNNGAAAAYLKVFNLAVAPTVGTSVATMTILLPAGGGATISVPPQGIAFSTGISYAITGVGTTADTTAVAAAQVFVNGMYT